MQPKTDIALNLTDYTFAIFLDEANSPFVPTLFFPSPAIIVEVPECDIIIKIDIRDGVSYISVIKTLPGQPRNPTARLVFTEVFFTPSFNKTHYTQPTDERSFSVTPKFTLIKTTPNSTTRIYCVNAFIRTQVSPATLYSYASYAIQNSKTSYLTSRHISRGDITLVVSWLHQFDNTTIRIEAFINDKLDPLSQIYCETWYYLPQV